MEDNNNEPEKDENAFEDPINKALSDPETPLIIISSETDPQIVQKVEKYNVSRYLFKEDFNALIWLETIKAFIDLKKALDKTKII